MRPDQAKFDEFVTPLLRFDDTFETYAKRGGFSFERNPHRRPGRILRRGSNPVLIVEMFLEPVWFDVSYDESLPYGFSVAAYFEELGANHRLWKFVNNIASSRPLAWMQEHISTLLEDAMASVQQCTPEYIAQHGSEATNLRARYRT